MGMGQREPVSSHRFWGVKHTNENRDLHYDFSEYWGVTTTQGLILKDISSTSQSLVIAILLYSNVSVGTGCRSAREARQLTYLSCSVHHTQRNEAWVASGRRGKEARACAQPPYSVLLSCPLPHSTSTPNGYCTCTMYNNFLRIFSFAIFAQGF